jgi:hypothetical protein
MKKSTNERKTLKLNKSTLKNLTVTSGVRAGGDGTVCPPSTGSYCGTFYCMTSGCATSLVKCSNQLSGSFSTSSS